MTGPSHGDKVYLLDAHNIAHRWARALPVDMYTSPSGQQIGAFAGIVREVKRLWVTHERRWLIGCIDGGHGWRAQLLPTYKSGRKPAPPEIDAQIAMLPDLLDALRVPVVRVADVEADDVIATLTEQAVARGCEVMIVSTDKDLRQLIRGDMRGPGSVRVRAQHDVLGPDEVRKAFGVGPEMLADLLALTGDKSDAIPGVRGIGKTKAPALLLEHGGLESLLDQWMLVPGADGERLRDGAAQARLSRLVVGLCSDIAVPLTLDNVNPWIPSRAGLDAFFRRFGYPRFEAAVDPARE
jgi:DNA polymerase-1